MSEGPGLQIVENSAYDERQITSGSLTEEIGSIEGREELEESLDEEMSWEDLVELGYASSIRFERLGHPDDIAIAIRCYELSIDLTEDNHPAKPPLLNNLGNSYACRFERYGELADINKAIDYQSQAVQLTPKDHEDRPAWLDNLGCSYRRRFARLGELSDIDEAIDYHNQAILLIPEGHTARAAPLTNLGDSHLCRFERLGELVDVDQAVKYQHEALILTADSDDHEEKLTVLSNLGNSYLRRFERTGEVADIDKAIDQHGQAVMLTPEDYADKPRWLNNLGSSYLCRFEHFGKIEDVDKAIEHLCQAVPLAADGHADRPAILNNLAMSYQGRFDRLGALADLDKAIEYQDEAVLLTPEGHADKPAWYGNLGNLHLDRFERFGDVADVDKAIKWQSLAESLSPDNHAGKPGQLNNLGNSYMRRFERLGELADVDKAIQYHIRATLLIPEDHALRLTLLSNLGISYKCRFERLGELPDIDKAIEHQSQAVSLTPETHSDRPTRLSNLGISYMHRSNALGEVKDVDKAIKYHKEAVHLIPEGHPQEPAWLNNLGNSYLRRFESLGEIADINEAIKCLGQAVLLSPDNHPDKITRVNNLGNAYLLRFEAVEELENLDKAIECYTQAVLPTPNGHASKPTWLKHLGSSHLRRFERIGERADAENANKSFQQATQLPIINPGVQFSSAREWAKTSFLLDVSPQLAYQRAMELVPQLVWLGVNIGRRYDLLAEIGDVAMEAAAWAISVQAYDLAVEWLEQGRSIVWNQILQLRTPFEELSTADPVLAQRLSEVGRELEQAGSRSATSPSAISNRSEWEREAQYHHSLATKWDQLLNTARTIPGFHDFMLPRKVATLMRAARNGPVVVINVHQTRCDALILQPNAKNVAHVPLKNLSLEKAINSQVQLMSWLGCRGDRTRGLKLVTRAQKQEEKLKGTLAVLWSDVAKPILDFLEFTTGQPLIEELPHVTWCTTGPLSFLPLHAAGCYNGSQLNTYDLVVSSYTPTLSALLAPSSVARNLPAGILAVGQEHTQGLGDLPNTVHELAVIKKHATVTHYLQLDGDRATASAVLDAMDECSWVHLACHASQNQDPSQSAFHLCDGSLTLSTITQRSFENKGLAFLSACQTATGDAKLPDEAIHLAAGMLMAGYPSVIATMWSIHDEDAPEIADRVYADLLRDGRMDCMRVAEALHIAVDGLRAKVGVSSFERWVPFVHMGY